MFRLALLSILPFFILANFSYDTDLDFFNLSPFYDLSRRNFNGFTCWLSCSERATVMCHYIGLKDEGNAERPSSFNYDPVVSRDCQQKSTSSYQSVHEGWDR